MASAALDDARKVDPNCAVSVQVALSAAAGLMAAWLAAGSTGLVGGPLAQVLANLALLVAIIAAWPSQRPAAARLLTLLGAIALANVMMAVSIAPLGVLAVPLVLAMLARTRDDLAGRVLLLAALAAATLGLFRLAVDSIPAVWLAADAVGRTMGRVAGLLADRPLEVGASFAGLDLLVLMATFYAGWLAWTAPPRKARAIYAAAAIICAQTLYLVLLARVDDLLAALPGVVLPPRTESVLDTEFGIWSWSNALRTALPWNLPLAGAGLQALVAAAMIRWAKWLPLGAKPQAAAADNTLLRWSAVVLAAALPLAAVLSLSPSNLKEKTIVAYRPEAVDWSRPEHGKPLPRPDEAYGTLPLLVESLGGRFIFSDTLAQRDLDRADVLLVVNPDAPWPEDRRERLWQFVRNGGSLLVAAGPPVHDGPRQSNVGQLLEPTAIRVRSDAAIPKTPGWEDALGRTSHPAAASLGSGRIGWGAGVGSSLEVAWRAAPLLVGRWGWSDPGSSAARAAQAGYQPGERLGDLVLAAEQHLGKGRVAVLGDATCLSCQSLGRSYSLVGRLLGELAHRPSTPQLWWRQLLAVVIALAMVAALAWWPDARSLAEALLALAASLLLCGIATDDMSRVLPDGRGGEPNNLAYIDAAHLEAYHDDPRHGDGLGNFLQTLAGNGYLPLLAPDLDAKRLERAGLLVSIAPGRAYSPDEGQTVLEFVRDGGIFIAIVGAEEAAPSGDLLRLFDLSVPPSPVPAPGGKLFSPSRPKSLASEPEPLGNFRQTFASQGESSAYVMFYAAWPVDGAAEDETLVWWSNGSQHRPVVVKRQLGQGAVVVIGDTYFAANKNLSLSAADAGGADNAAFWRWLLAPLRGQQPWTPPPKKPDELVPDETLADPSEEAAP